MSQHSDPPTALLVEDDDDLALLLVYILQREGYQVDRCADGREAKARVSQPSAPTLAILDIMLPYVDGFELIQTIRRNPSWSQVPILMLTSQDREEEIVRALDSGADDYLVKPFQPEELKARLRRLKRTSP